MASNNSKEELLKTVASTIKDSDQKIWLETTINSLSDDLSPAELRAALHENIQAKEQQKPVEQNAQLANPNALKLALQPKPAPTQTMSTPNHDFLNGMPASIPPQQQVQAALQLQPTPIAEAVKNVNALKTMHNNIGIGINQSVENQYTGAEIGATIPDGYFAAPFQDRMPDPQATYAAAVLGVGTKRTDETPQGDPLGTTVPMPELGGENNVGIVEQNNFNRNLEREEDKQEDLVKYEQEHDEYGVQTTQTAPTPTPFKKPY